MIRKEISYVDYNGNGQTDVAYFHLSKAEIGKLQMRQNGTFIDRLQDLVARRKVEALYDFIYNLVLDSYGERDPEGRKFIKSEEMRTDFEQSIAFSEFLMDLLSDSDKLSTFVKDIIPRDLMTAAGEVDAKAIPETV